MPSGQTPPPPRTPSGAPAEPRVPRAAARVAVLDPEGAVFLFHYDNVEVGPHWSMPGGGLDPGESPREGALRELREETGWQDLAPGPLLCTWEHDYTRDEARVRQHEHIYLAYGPHRDPQGAGLAEAHAEDHIQFWRWWTPAELEATEEALWPPRLPELLAAVRAAVRAAGPDAAPEPVDYGYVPNAPRPALRSDSAR